MTLDDRIAQIADIPLGHLERRFAELSAAMTRAAEEGEQRIKDVITEDEKLAQVIAMVHSRGIATAMEIAATEVGNARKTLQTAADQLSEEAS